MPKNIAVCIAVAILIVGAAMFLLLCGCALITAAWAKPDRTWKRIVRACVRVLICASLAGTVYFVTLVICQLH